MEQHMLLYYIQTPQKCVHCIIRQGKDLKFILNKNNNPARLTLQISVLVYEGRYQLLSAIFLFWSIPWNRMEGEGEGDGQTAFQKGQLNLDQVQT